MRTLGGHQRYTPDALRALRGDADPPATGLTVACARYQCEGLCVDHSHGLVIALITPDATLPAFEQDAFAAPSIEAAIDHMRYRRV